LISFSRTIQWYHSLADPIWPDGTFKFYNLVGTFLFKLFFLLPGDSERKGEDKTVAESAARMATATGTASQSGVGYYDRGGYHSLHPLLLPQSGEKREYWQLVSCTGWSLSSMTGADIILSTLSSSLSQVRRESIGKL
jgi:hypothetical protein